jgi:hypothetical protein
MAFGKDAKKEIKERMKNDESGTCELVRSIKSVVYFIRNLGS